MRQVGSDFAAGEVLLKRGTDLRAADLGLLAASGATTAKVHARPRLCLFSTGDELNREVFDDQCMVHDTNRPALIALLSSAGDFGGGAVVVDCGCVRDKREAVKAALLAVLDTADVVVSTGGVSEGMSSLCIIY